MAEIWRKCSSCKGDIMTGQSYYVCSVSTCQAKVTNYAFCSIPCWDAHVPTERHRPDSAGAIERTAPRVPEAAPPPRRVMASGSPQPSGQTGSSDNEVLVVVTKVRKYIADKAGMNTSGSVYDALTERVKRLCDRAIDEARAQGRKTVMDRDFH